MSLPTLKKLLGHKFLSTTLIYVYTAMKAARQEYRRTNPFTEHAAAQTDSLM